MKAFNCHDWLLLTYNQSLYKTDGDKSSDESQQIFW